MTLCLDGEQLRDAWMDTHECVGIDAILFADANELQDLIKAGRKCQATREYRATLKRYYMHLCECRMCAVE